MIERILEVFQLGLKNLLRNKLRSFLTMLGMIFGVGSVIAMLAVGAGARHEILSRIQELGIRNIILNSVRPPESLKADDDTESYKEVYGLTFEDETYLRDVLPPVERVYPVNSAKKRVWYRSKRVEGTILGVEPEYLELFNLAVDRGRPFTDVDDISAQKVCVVRRSLIRRLETMEDPIGMVLMIDEQPFEIIGLLADEEFRSHTAKALAINEGAEEVYVPYTTTMRTFGTINYVVRAGSEEYTECDLDQIVVVAKTSDVVEDTAQMIASALGNAHEKEDFEIVVPLELLRQSEETQQVFNIVMILIASISLIVGGIGIANIMLATITERTKEIGIRRAIGAKRVDIMLQFLTETTAIALIGGLFGCAFAFAVIAAIVRYTEWTAVVEPHYILISLGISCVVGILFGIFPARRASLMDPISALRYE